VGQFKHVPTVSPTVSHSTLFKQLVYRAIEEEINIQRGAELLNVSFKQVSQDLRQFNDEE